MPIATLTSSGRITLPSQVRRSLGLNAGDQIEFFRQPDGSYVLRPLTGSVLDLKGSVLKPEKPVSIAQMKGAVAAGAQSRYRYSRK